MMTSFSHRDRAGAGPPHAADPGNVPQTAAITFDPPHAST